MSAKCESALVRLCHNTLTHSAHTTHTAQPVYLYPWVDIPAFCLLVTAPSAHHTTPHHTTPHHTTPHHTTPHHTTPHHTTPHHTTPHHWFHCPLPQGSEAVHCRSCTAHCPQQVRQCIAGVALPTAPRRWGSALQELHCPLPPGSEAVHCRSSTAHCPQAVRQCIAGVALPTAPRQ